MDYKQEVLRRTNRLLSLIRRVQQFFYCCVCIRYSCKVSTEPLPSNDKGFLQNRSLATIRGFLPSRCLATIGGYTDTHRQQRDLISLLLFFQNKGSRLKNGRKRRGLIAVLSQHLPAVLRESRKILIRPHGSRQSRHLGGIVPLRCEWFHIPL
jgi:hypothetical protein